MRLSRRQPAGSAKVGSSTGLILKTIGTYAALAARSINSKRAQVKPGSEDSGFTVHKNIKILYISLKFSEEVAIMLYENKICMQGCTLLNQLRKLGTE